MSKYIDRLVRFDRISYWKSYWICKVFSDNVLILSVALKINLKTSQTGVHYMRIDSHKYEKLKSRDYIIVDMYHDVNPTTTLESSSRFWLSPDKCAIANI